MKAIVVILDSLRRDHVGCYGADSIHTPALDQLSRESVRYTNPKPEALATIQTRRALHTGNRVFPFGGHQSAKGDNVRLLGWGAHSDSVVTMSEIARNAGLHTGLVTDTYHQFKPSMNFHRGFDQFRWIRGQENDHWNSLQFIDNATAAAHSYPAQAQRNRPPANSTLSRQCGLAPLRRRIFRPPRVRRGDALRRRQPRAGPSCWWSIALIRTSPGIRPGGMSTAMRPDTGEPTSSGPRTGPAGTWAPNSSG